MKKTLLLFFCAIALVITSCKKEYINQNNNQTIQFTTTNSSWITSDGGVNYSTSLTVPEIDKYFNDHGGVLVYISFDGGQNYDQVPEVYQGVSYSYQHTVGGIVLGAQAYNSTNAISNPGSTVIKVVLVDSN
ncbi:hypothetical protein [Mucilaginibacter sp. KACC 22063]|uniref:hypothetical protein n=1 Tax=Mucilaginibacter sp. KACC 22063 TaxID=3025666 RepID=UPI00236500B8|nr:hypothetical protein [Mucilaginibacter sp. KACC 22063]WDF53924.1 hypothetical protein PQ461_13330 [Mucilaginibacter sp. KACC 22063]